MARKRCKWTEKEDEILKIAVGKDVERIDWLSIAEYVPGRNNKECRKRWHLKFSTNTSCGSWTEQEDARLHTAINQHGTKWAIVAQGVGTRSSEQCSKRWKDALNPELNRSPWSDEDDNLLVSSVDTYGRNWKMISQLHFQDRSTLSLKNRHALLLRRQARENQDQRDTLQSPEAYSGIGWTSQQDALTTHGDSLQSSQSNPRDAAADGLGNIPDSQNDFQNAKNQMNLTNEMAVVSPAGLGGNSFMPYGNDALMGEMSRLIQCPSFSPDQVQQNRKQQHACSDISSFNPLQPGIDTSISLTPPSMAPNSKDVSNDPESWEDYLCLGISCPRQGLEAFKVAVLEAVMKGPGCESSGDDEKVQIMLKIRRT